ncbi:MAG: Uma2 family endonuclease [Halochromatium sp.]|uniref:Uma2 family endonuclease n=1 Tax=Halochromatium sp. TaxID=2049430 RepID=UPI00397CA065
MSQPALETPFDHAAYLSWEEQQPEKHEFFQGEVFAMVGARREHVVVALNIAAALKQRLRGGPCQAYIADMKLHVSAVDAFFYPDVMVSCDPRDHAAERYLEHPTLLIEVLSETTAAFDRGEKFAAYRTLPDLQEYALVDVRARRIESYRRTGECEWLLRDYYLAQGDCRFSSLDLTLSVDEIFENVDATPMDYSG